MKDRCLVVVLGPTAIGKTAVAVSLARHFSTSVLSCDARQFYRELNIGVARPSEEELASAPHAFIAHIGIHDDYSAGKYSQEARAWLEEEFRTHRVVICAGGSGLYLGALLNGFDDLPSDVAVRQELQTLYRDNGIGALQEALRIADPGYFKEVDRSNPHRLMRALEVCRITGKPYSTQRNSGGDKLPYSVFLVGLEADRAWLHDRINRRVDLMMRSGLEEEARGLYHLRHLNALNTVGYKELFEYFGGTGTLEEVAGKIRQHTRQYARRQMTWNRRIPGVHWYAVDKDTDLIGHILQDLDAECRISS